MNENEIESIEVRSFEGLSNLIVLYLYNNKLKRIDSNMFKNLAKLEWLLLYNNEIEEIDVNSFEALSNVKWLDLQNNKLKEVDRKCFEPLRSIKVIYLHENVGLNAKSFIKPWTQIWYDDVVQEIVKQYGCISRWNRFIQQFPDSGNNIYLLIVNHFILI